MRCDFGDYQLGQLTSAREYNFFRDETDPELNPCSIFYSREDREDNKDHGYKTVPSTIAIAHGKIHVGSLLVCPEAKFISAMRYNPERASWAVHPTSELCRTEMFGWDRFLNATGQSMKFSPDRLVEIPGFDAMPPDAGKLHLRGVVLKAMIEGLPGFQLQSTSFHPTVLHLDEGAPSGLSVHDVTDSLYYTVLLQ